jgi:2-oxoglutarate ferredoxin oxidoreductase subunit delta
MSAKSEEDKKKAYKPRIFKGTVYIIKNRCKGCNFCIEYCPKQILVASEEFNEKGYHFPVVTDDKACVNCKVCEDICPEFAIFSITREENESTDSKEKSKSKDT